ncbi:mRNA (2'-O-methyladenosine-N(6)-)-methyltransferase [Malassezia sp. CBS 17886]|nr:mRNA (2'-O-methyladenosine-N(6)-)-methyltransferase [Malassezia sp. CBS 17886]
MDNHELESLRQQRQCTRDRYQSLLDASAMGHTDACPPGGAPGQVGFARAHSQWRAFGFLPEPGSDEEEPQPTPAAPRGAGKGGDTPDVCADDGDDVSSDGAARGPAADTVCAGNEMQKETHAAIPYRRTYGAEKQAHGKCADASDEIEQGARLLALDRGDSPAKAPASLGPGYSKSEDTIYNDYSQAFIDSGLTTLPGTWVQGADEGARFAEHPRLHRLRSVKSDLVQNTSTPPLYLRENLRSWLPSSTDTATMLPREIAGAAFDVVVIDPPLASYHWQTPALPHSETWSWDEIAALPVPALCAKEAFVFLWVGGGASDGLERGREVLTRWGFRRCEDIVWVRTNAGPGVAHRGAPAPLLAPSVQHCLMGIRGTVVRSTDHFFVHCNIDTDVILWPGEPIYPSSTTVSPLKKPPELYSIVEHFCLGTRRLELFGTNRNLRRGWLTVGRELGPHAPDWKPNPRSAPQPLVPAALPDIFPADPPGCPLPFRTHILPHSDECEALRPKTPPGARRTRPRSPAPWPAQPPAWPPSMPMWQPPPVPIPWGAAAPGAPLPGAMWGPMYPTGVPPPPSSTFYAPPVWHSAHPAPPSLPHPGAAWAPRVFQPQPPLSALVGQGAGRRDRVSVQSGSERLSGSQAEVLKRTHRQGFK